MWGGFKGKEAQEEWAKKEELDHLWQQGNNSTTSMMHPNLQNQVMKYHSVEFFQPYLYWPKEQ